MSEENPFVVETVHRILRENGEQTVDECLRAIAILSGRFRMSPSEMSSVTSAYKKLLSTLSKKPFDSLSFEQWASFIDSLCKNEFVDSTVWTLSKEDSDRLGTTETKEEAERQKNLIRRIRCFLMEFNIIPNLINVCWKGCDSDIYLHVLTKNKHLPEPTSEEVSKAKVILQLFSLDWMDVAMDPILIRNIAISSLAFIKSTLGKESYENISLFDTAAAIHEKAIHYYFVTSELTPENDRFLKTITKGYDDILNEKEENDDDSDQFLKVLDIFLSTLPWLPRGEKEDLCDEGTIWDCIGRMTEIVDQEMDVKSKAMETESLDSPEENTFAQDIGAGVVQICESVSKDLDQQLAEEKARSERINKLRERVSTLLYNVSSKSASVPNEKITSILHKLCDLSATCFSDYPELSKAFESAVRNGAISETIQEYLVEDCLKLGHFQSEWVVKNVVSSATPKMRNSLAEKIIRFFVSQIKSKHLDGEKHSFSSEDLEICRSARCSMTQEKSALFKEILTYFNQLCSQKRMAEDPLIDQIMSMMHIMFTAGCFLENMADTETTESYSDLVKAIVPLSSTGCSQSELSAASRHFASWSLNQSNFLCLPYVFPVFTEKELEETNDFVVLSYMFRLTPFFRSSHGSELFKAMYTDSDFMEKVDEYFSPKNTEALFARILGIFSEHIQSKIGKPSTVEAQYILAFYDCLLVAFSSSEVQLPVSTMASLRQMLKNLDLYDLSSTASVRFGNMVGIERLSSLFKIYRNHMLNECMSFQKMVDDCVDDVVLDMMHHDKKKVISPAYPSNEYRLSSDKLDFVLDGEKLTMVESIIECIRAEVAAYIFGLFKNDTNISNMCDGFREEVAKFLIEVSSSAQYSVMDAESANTFLNMVVPDNYALHHVFLLNTILAVATNTEPQDSFEKYPLNQFLGDVLSELFSSEIYAKRWTKNPPMDPLEEYLSKCADSTDFSFALNPNLVSALSSIFCNSKTDPSIKNGIAQTVLSNIHSLPDWVRGSQFPAVVLSGFKGIFRYLEGNSDVVDKIKRAVSECVELVIRPSVVQELAEFVQIEVQSTDRFAQSSLKSRPAKEPKALSHMRNIGKRPAVTDIFSDTLKMLCTYGDSETHLKIIKAISEVLCGLCGLSSEEEKVVRGETVLQNASDNQILFRTCVANALLKYCVELYKELSEEEEGGYFSESEGVKNVINRKGGATALPSVLRKSEGGQKSGGKLCTYTTTETHFVQQHWYNCYTCQMTENVGMCSVCAVNCHRGHDVVYCKFGSFFCDCGAKNCDSMKSTAITPSANNAARGRKIIIENSKCDEPVETALYSFPKNIGEFSETIISHLNKIQKEMEKHVPEIDNAVRASVDAHMNMWTTESKRELVLESLKDGVKIVTDQAVMDILENYSKSLNGITIAKRPADQQHMERLKPRDICGVVKLGASRQLWLMLDGTTLTIHHISHGENIVDELTSARQDTETIPFAARRISCCDNKAVIIGRSEILLLRFGRDGEITERTPLSMGEIPAHTNPMIKAVWAPKRPATVAVATTQYVRIFDITLDTAQHLEDLVLPVGNVQDLLLVDDDGNLCVLVLSNAGHLYRHVVTTTLPTSSSYFLTNTLDCPTPQAGPPISIHYSPVSHLFFLSYETAVWFAVVKDGNFRIDSLRLEWKKLPCDHALNCWQESSGIIAAMNTQGGHNITYFYPTNKQLLMQKLDHCKRTPYAHLIYTSPSNTTINGLMFFYDSPHIVPLTAHWASLPDLWIDGLPLEFSLRADSIKEDTSEELPIEDLVTMMEVCEPLERVEVMSEDVQRFYDNQDMTHRLHTVSQYQLTLMNLNHFTLRYKLSDQGYIPRAIRIEVPGTKGPWKVEIGSRQVKLTSSVSRFFDVVLTRAESLKLETGDLPLKFIARENTIVLTSVRLFGIRRRDFGFPSPQVAAKSPLSLPDAHIVSLLNLFRVLGQNQLFVSKKDWLINMGQQLTSFRSTHREVATAANHLLRVLFDKDLIGYYTTKDDIFFDDLMSLISSNSPLPEVIVNTLALQMKLVLCTRCTPFLKRLTAVENGPVKMINYLINQVVLQVPEESIPLVELLCATTFVFLSNLEDTEEIADRFLSLFTDTKAAHVTHLVRLVAQSLIYSFSLTTRNDRQKLSSTSTKILKHGGLRPYFNESKILTEEEDISFVDKMLGPMVSADLVKNTDMFDLEAKFLVQLLKKVLIKLRDEGTMSTVSTYTKNEAVPTLSLLIFAIVLLAQLYPEKMLPTLTELIGMIDWKNPSTEKTENNYRQFLLVRLVSVFLAKCGDHVENKKKESKEKKEAKAKSREGSSDEPLPVENSRESSVDVVQAVEDVTPPPTSGEKPKRRSIERLLDDIVSRLNAAQVLPFCLTVLQSVVTHWKGPMPDVHSSAKKAWARDNRTANVADINALKVDGSKGDVDDQFHAMVTDVVLRLPLQMKKINKSLDFSNEWTDVLCEMVLLPHAQSVRHQAKKLLICLCGDKAQFQAIRDKYLMKDQMRRLREKFKDSNEGMSHQELTEIVEIINALSKTAAERPLMWHVICEEQLTWMLDMASRISDPVSTNVLELLVAAIRVEAPMENIHIADSVIAVEENRMFLKKLLMRFLVGRDEGRRWLAHGLLRSTMQLASRANQLTLIRIMWFELWPMARGNGVNGAQLADLLATYLPRVLSSQELLNVCENELMAIQKTADRIVAEGHDRTYEMFTGLGLGWGFMLMVSNPCLNCFTKKRVNEIMKLSSIKQDTRFSSNAMLVKLAGFYEVSRLIIKLSEVKRAKMVKKIKVSYCPKAVDSPVDLKTKPELWQSAGSTTVSNGEGEMVVSLSVPIVTSSLIIQFTELSESRQNNELHCPRCSSVVQPNPGVCENCGENAFQCFKCRSINYDDKDPFLCQNCGFCKYARIDVSVECRPLPRVQPITSDADRAAAIDHMSQLLVDVEQFRSQMHMGRAMCESLWLRSRPLPAQDMRSEGDNSAMMTIGGIPNIPTNEHPVYCVKEIIKYCSVAHEELCSHTQQLLAYREELRQYDRTLSADVGTLCNGFYNTSASCFGCLCAGIRHSVAILQGICDDAGCTSKILGNDETYKNLAKLGQKYLPLNGDVESFVCRLAFENQEGAERLCELVEEGVIPGTVLCKSILIHQDSLWQMKLRSLFKIAISRSDEDTIVNSLLLIDQLLTDGRNIRKRAFRKFHDVENDPCDDVPMQRKVRITNRKVDNRKALANWMKSNDQWEECSESGILDDVIQDIYSWLWECLFSRWSLVRSAVAKVFLNLSKHPGYLGTVVRIVLRGVSIAVGKPPLVAEQFFSAVNAILNKRRQLRLNFYLHGLHIWLLNFIHEECKRLYEEEHEGGNIDHSNGIVLRNFVELLVSLLCGSASEGILLKAAVDHMLLPLLQATIYLKRLLLHRTRSIDICRQALELLLRKVSSKEPLLLMHATVRTLSQDLDQYTQAQVVSVIMEVLAPERHKDDGFLIQIEKDPAQEDFLQGRMTGNPYKSSDAGLGPLMRDIKNKICRDTEMIALLEDDNGMELLVNNQIISLSLPVAAVFDKLWHRDHPGQPLTIVYRMRGLMGDAVEPFVSSLGDKEENSAEDSVLSSLVEHFEACGGIAKILEIVENCDVSTSGRILLTHSLGLLERCAKSEKGRIALVKAGVVRVFTKILRRCVENEHDGVLAIGSDCLKQLGSLVTDVRTHEHLHHLTADDARWLSNLALKKYGFDLRGDLSAEVARLLGSLVLGDDGAEEVLVDCCRETFRWCIIDTTTDVNRRSVIVQDAETLCEVVAGILPSTSGIHLKNKIVSSGVVEEACNYLLNSHPPLYSATESQEWKSFLMRPSLRLMLTFMQSMAKGHIGSQNALSEQSLPVLHRLEQVASDNSIGTLAENVMEALKENAQVAKKIEAVRLETRQKKRQMAMAMRNKQLSKMGMQVGKQGEVKIAARKIANEPHLEEVADPLAACCICREPLLRGDRAAAVYAFASISTVSDTPLLGSVSQMVMVHIDCHMAAIRRSGGGRNTDEWTKAALHNAGARCNILTPVVAGDPNDVPFQTALARFQTDLDVITTTPAVTRALIFKDICQLIDRFINYQSFSDKSQGGGRESNAQYLGVLHLLACALPAGELSTLLPQWRLYSFLMTEQSLATWNEQRLDILRAALNDSANTGRHTWEELKLTCLAWSFVDGYFRQVIPIDDPDRVLWLRENLLSSLKKTSAFVQNFDSVAASKDFETFASAVDIPAADFTECFH